MADTDPTRGVIPLLDLVVLKRIKLDALTASGGRRAILRHPGEPPEAVYIYIK